MASEDQPPPSDLAGDEEGSPAKEEATDITGKKLPTAAGGNARVTSPQPAEHTGKGPKNQAKAAPAAPTPQQLIDKKSRAISAALAEKELLVLAYIDQRVPYPYCESWRHETNKNFSLLVRLRHRRLSWAKSS